MHLHGYKTQMKLKGRKYSPLNLSLHVRQTSNSLNSSLVACQNNARFTPNINAI